MTEDDYTVRLINLPHGVRGFVSLSPDGHLNIYLNARLNWEMQLRAFRHELDHAENDDLFSDLPIRTVESRRPA